MPSTTSIPFSTDISEEAAQSSLSLLAAALRTTVTDLRMVYESLGEPQGSEATTEDDLPTSLAAHLRTAIECAILDYLEPAIRIVGGAAIASLADLGCERQEDEPSEAVPP